MMAMRVHSSWTSLRMCELKSTVLPRSCRSSMMRLTSTRPTGSSPVIGSSSSTSSGSLMSAWAMPTRCSMPLEYLRRCVSAACSRPTSPRSASTRSRLRLAVEPEQPGAEAQELAAGEVVVEVRVLGQVADVRDARHAQLHRAGGRPHQPERDLDRRRLAGAVRARAARTRRSARTSRSTPLRISTVCRRKPDVDRLVQTADRAARWSPVTAPPRLTER